MATNFPTSLDSLTNPTSSSALNLPSHSSQHADANDAIEALQAKVGIDSSADTTSLDYKINNLGGYDAVSFTPTISTYGSPSLGNGSISGKYVKVGDLLTVHVVVNIGSTTTDEYGNPQITLPDSMSWAQACTGVGVYSDYFGSSYKMSVFGSSTYIYSTKLVASTTNLTRGSQLQGSGEPVTPSTNDVVYLSITGIVS